MFHVKQLLVIVPIFLCLAVVTLWPLIEAVSSRTPGLIVLFILLFIIFALIGLIAWIMYQDRAGP